MGLYAYPILRRDGELSSIPYPKFHLSGGNKAKDYNATLEKQFQQLAQQLEDLKSMDYLNEVLAKSEWVRHVQTYRRMIASRLWLLYSLTESRPADLSLASGDLMVDPASLDGALKFTCFRGGLKQLSLTEFQTYMLFHKIPYQVRVDGELKIIPFRIFDQTTVVEGAEIAQRILTKK